MQSFSEMKLTGVFLIFLCFKAQSSAKIVPIIAEEFEVCDQKNPHISKDFELIAINDTLTIVNGTLKTLIEIASPIKGGGFCEQYIRGQWVYAQLARKLDDLCATLNNPTEPWFKFLEDRDDNTCPFPVGSKIYFREQKIDFSSTYYPYNFVGGFSAI